jgi:hypothetical protein
MTLIQASHLCGKKTKGVPAQYLGVPPEIQLAVTIDDLARNFDNNLQTDIAILDFSKAFDTVPHNKFLHKLEAYGIRGNLYQWYVVYVISPFQIA